MGAKVSCDACKRDIEEGERVWEDAESHTPLQHVCEQCYYPALRLTHVERAATDVIEAESARRHEASAAPVARMHDRYKDVRTFNCGECHAVIFLDDDVDACFFCGHPVPADVACTTEEAATGSCPK